MHLSVTAVRVSCACQRLTEDFPVRWIIMLLARRVKHKSSIRTSVRPNDMYEYSLFAYAMHVDARQHTYMYIITEAKCMIITRVSLARRFYIGVL